MSTSIYNFILRNTQTDESVEFEAARSRKLSWVLNRAGTCSFVLDISDDKLKAMAPNTRGIWEILVYRDGRMIWAGRVWDVSDDISGDGGTVTITAKEILHVLSEKRFITGVTYTGVDAGQIAWNMINFTQIKAGGDLGITQGNIVPTQARDRTFEEEPIGEEIIALTEVIRGFDFVMSPTLQLDSQGVFSVFQKKGVIQENLSLEYGEDTLDNITSFSRKRSLTTVANYIKAFGEGMGSAMGISIQQDNTLIASTLLLEDNISFKSVSRQTTLDDHAKEELRVSKVERPIYDLTISNVSDLLGRFDTGDSISVVVKLGYMNVSEIMRIYAIELSIDDSGQENISLTVSPIT